MSRDVREFGKIGVLMGGYSAEREISLKSGKAIYAALAEQGFSVSPLDIIEKDEERIKEFLLAADMDLAFIALHGVLGEDGKIQQILEELRVPYAGSGIEASRLALDKSLSQEIFRQKGLPVPENCVLERSDSYDPSDIVRCLGGLPLVIKPACEGSSIGVNIVQGETSLKEGIEACFRLSQKIIIEKYISGKELTVGILDEEALPVIEIRSTNPFFDFTAKYEKGRTEYIVPAPISEGSKHQVQKIALNAHRALGCSDFSRVDVILDAQEQPYILEVNTIPGFTETSLLPKAAREKGINFHQLCFKLTELAYGKKKEKVRN